MRTMPCFLLSGRHYPELIGCSLVTHECYAFLLESDDRLADICETLARSSTPLATLRHYLEQDPMMGGFQILCRKNNLDPQDIVDTALCRLLLARAARLGV